MTIHTTRQTNVATCIYTAAIYMRTRRLSLHNQENAQILKNLSLSLSLSLARGWGMVMRYSQQTSQVT